jgi:two-component system, OmpR family, manganese sensing sensor histidine kinase
MFQTTRRRLALWYTTVTAVLLLLFATGVYFYVRSTLIERIDDTLNHVVEVVQRSIVIEPVNPHSEGGPLRVNVEASFRDNAATGEDDRIDLEWFSPTGDLLWSTLAEPLNLPLHPDREGETVQVDRTPPTPDPLILRQVTHRLQVGRYVLGYLRVSHPWFEVTKPVRELLLDLSLGTGLMVGAVGAIGWLLSGLAMEPVRESYQRLKQFTSDASHELRSPIAIIQTNVQVALADPEPDPENQQYHLRVVERLTRRLGRLVDDLLFLARQDSGIVQPRWAAVVLDELLQDVVEEQQTLAGEKGIALGLTVVEPKPADPKLALSGVPGAQKPLDVPVPTSDWAVLQADRDQLARLFTNLVGNALQYTPPAGQVAVGLQRLGRSGAYCFQVTVSDTGIGIAAEALPHLFDRFYRVDPARTQAAAGSGLGLAIAQAIVETHQGQIQIDSSLGRGTIVTVTLPRLFPKSEAK